MHIYGAFNILFSVHEKMNLMHFIDQNDSQLAKIDLLKKGLEEKTVYPHKKWFFKSGKLYDMSHQYESYYMTNLMFRNGKEKSN